MKACVNKYNICLEHTFWDYRVRAQGPVNCVEIKSRILDIINAVWNMSLNCTEMYEYKTQKM